MFEAFSRSECLHALFRIAEMFSRAPAKSFRSIRLIEPVIAPLRQSRRDSRVLQRTLCIPGATTRPSFDKPATCSFLSKAFTTGRRDPILAIPKPYRNVSLTAAQRQLVKGSVPALQDRGLDITTVFYRNMLKANPSLNNIFNTANQEHLQQPRALANAVLAYAANIDNLTPLMPTVELVAAKHASLYVRPEQYAIVGEHLIAAIGEVLGDVMTPELQDAWVAAYWQLAGIFINKENSLYEASEGWTGWRDFRIAKKIRESDEVTSFYLEPVEGGSLPTFRPGQVSVRSVLVEP